jgi:hypothetical protein
MPQIVSCPDCGRQLRVPDNLLGKNVKCPGCGQKFLAEAPGEMLDEAPASGTAFSARPDDRPRRRDDASKSRRRADEEEDEDYRDSRRRDDYGAPEPSKADVRQGWERVRFGLNLIIIGAWVLVGTVVAAVSGWLVLILVGAMSFASIFGSTATAFGPSTTPAQAQTQASQAAGQAAGTGCALLAGMILIWGLVVLLMLAYQALRITGLGFFMGIAKTRKTQYLKVLAIVVFCIALGSLVLPMLFTGLQYALLEARIGGCVIFSGWGLSGTLWLAEFICFFLFLRGVAAALKKEGLAQNVVIYMIATPIYYLTLLALPVIAFFGAFAALFGATASAAGSNSPGAAAGTFAGTGAALAVGGLVCVGLEVLIGIALFIWFMVLLYQVRGAVHGWLDRN